MNINEMTPRDKALHMFYLGDSIGAMAEGGAGGSCSYEKAMKGIKAFPRGTDESDTARLFLSYIEQCGRPQAAADIASWYHYHQANRNVSRYGRTWRDHFGLVKELEKKGRLTYKAVYQISVDRNSLGNGGLMLVFPAIMTGVDFATLLAIIKGTHYQAEPIAAMLYRLLKRYVSVSVVEESLTTHYCLFHDDYGMTPLAPYCLLAAIQVAKQPTIEEAVRFSLEKGGDVDSYLSLGLLLWAYLGDLLGDRNSEKQTDVFLGTYIDVSKQ